MSLSLWDRVVLRQVPLHDKTFYGVAGTAEYWAEVSSIEELAHVIKESKRRGLSWRVMGGGTNLLIQEGVLKGVTIRLKSQRFNTLHFEGNLCLAGAALSTPHFVQQCAGKNKGSVLVVGGVPGTLGGAVAMNAGTKAGTIEEIFVSASGFDEEGHFKTWKRSDCQFEYRSSSLNGCVLLSFVFDLGEDDPDASSKVQQWIDHKKDTQPYHLRSAGCMFRNPPGHSAGQLIESAGLKGTRQGGIEISSQHANFLVNHGRGTFSDARTLMEKIKKRVFEVHQIELVEEVVVWDEEV